MKPVLWIICIGFALGCKKERLPDDELVVSPTIGTRHEFTLDSIYLYARQIYLWNDVLPAYAEFNPRKYAVADAELKAFKQEVFELSQVKINPNTGLPYEFPIFAGLAKYSFIEGGTAGERAGKTAEIAVATGALLKTTVITVGGINVAYVALGSFPPLRDCKTVLDHAFAELAILNPRHIVLDLRANPGGYIETAEYIANLIAPSTLTGKVMYTEQYNTLLQAGKATLLRHQPYLDEEGKAVIYKGRNATMADVNYTEAANTYRFSKKGSVEGITDIYFIVSGTTASASEMLISVLKPYFKVRVAGVKTYGKPVGFFGVKIDVYNIYLSGFLIRNAMGWFDYFNGIIPDIPVTGSNDAALGDPSEACLNAVLSVIANRPASFTVRTIRAGSLHSAGLVQEQFKGMLENRLRLRTPGPGRLP